MKWSFKEQTGSNGSSDDDDEEELKPQIKQVFFTESEYLPQKLIEEFSFLLQPRSNQESGKA